MFVLVIVWPPCCSLTAWQGGLDEKLIGREVWAQICPGPQGSWTETDLSLRNIICMYYVCGHICNGCWPFLFDSTDHEKIFLPFHLDLY